MAKKINDAHLSLAYRLGESSVPTDATELGRRLDWFTTAINIVCAGTTPMWFLKSFTSMPTVANQQDYDLSALLVRKIYQIKVNNYLMEQIPFDEVYKTYEIPLAPVPILPSFMKRAYYFRYNSVYFIPIPSAAPTAITVTITSSGLVATGTSTTAHGLIRGDYVVIAGATPAAYNGTFMIETVPSTTTFTYTLASDPADTTTGTITATPNNIKIWYFANPTAPTAVDSSIVVPDEFMDILVAYAEGRYWSYAHKRGKSADAFTEFESRVADIKRENFRKMYGEN